MRHVQFASRSGSQYRFYELPRPVSLDAIVVWKSATYPIHSEPFPFTRIPGVRTETVLVTGVDRHGCACGLRFLLRILSSLRLTALDP